MFTDKAQKIIDMAKDCAFAQAKELLDIESLLAAMGKDAEAGVRLAACLTQGDTSEFLGRCPKVSHPVSCPGKMDLTDSLRRVIHDAVELASGEGVPDHSHPGLINLCHLVCAVSMSRDACNLLDGLSPLLREDALRFLTVWRDETDGASSIADLVSRLRGMRAMLLSKLFGQDHAIHAFVEGLYNAEITAATDHDHKLPLAIFVFAGPPGVGKTYMAELCASYLRRPFKRFDMTGYSDHQAHMQLVGFPETYRGAQPGALTGFVEKNPNAFLLFDEIEKAHLNTIQLFYQILDAGRLEDKFTDHDVSFRDTVIIFTTNAGRSIYDNPNKAGIGAANAGYHKRTILGALENEKNPTNGQPAFPSAICSRLAQGYPVMFNHLGINELERVSASELARTESLLQKQYFKHFSHDPLIPISLVLREGGRVDARQLRAETEKFVKTELFKFASLYAEENLEDAFEKIDRVHYEMACSTQDMTPEITALYEPADKPKVLLVANGRFANLCNKHMPEVAWFVASSSDEAVDVLATQDIDMVLLDIWVQRALEQAAEPQSVEDMMRTVDQGADYLPLYARALEDGRNILHKIQERFPGTPVYLLSFMAQANKEQKGDKGAFIDSMMQTLSLDLANAPESSAELSEPRRRAIDDELFLACVRAGGARGVIITNFVGTYKPDWEDQRDRFLESLLTITQRLYRERMALKLARERKVLVFETAADMDKDNRTLTIRLRDFRLGRAVDASDAGEMVEDVQRPSTRFEDILGAAEAKNALKFVVDWLRDPKRYKAMGIRPPKGILLAGPPGTGKTMLARAIAGESDCAYIEKSATSFVTIWQGSGPQNVRNLFERARRYAPAIVFIDEIDAIGTTRSGGMGAARAQEETLNAILTEMDGFGAVNQAPVIVLAATNLPDRLDEALKRRFDRTIEVDKPDRTARLLFLERAVASRKDSEVDRATLERLAGQTAGMTIADLERIIHEAAIMGAQQDRALCAEHIEEAFEKARMGEAKGRPDDETLERIARHEAGHAMIAWLGGNLPVQVTIVGRGGAGGFMEREVGENRILYTKPQIEQLIRESMGGRAAEILYYGEDAGLSTGVSSDLRHATQWAMRMVQEFGMNAEVGHLAVTDVTGNRGSDGPLSAQVAGQARIIVDEQMQKALALLKEKESDLNALATELLRKNRLTCDEIKAIIGK